MGDFEGPFGPMPWVGPQEDKMVDEDMRYVCPCGLQHAYPSLCPQEYANGKLTSTGYPGLPSTSQSDVINAKANDPGMYAIPKEDVLKLQNEPTVWAELLSPNQARLEFENIPNEQAKSIVMDILPKAMELYLKKSKDYGGNVMDRFGLGQKAAIPDMARKFGKLIDAIWCDKPLEFEQPDEILMDLIGHILIILDQRSQGQ